MAAEETTDSENIFRTEALAHRRLGGRRQGDLLRLSPGWMGWTYRLMLGFFVAAVLFLCLGRMDEYATGPAVVRCRFMTEVTSPVSALVQEVPVIPGTRVRAGQLLVRLGDAGQVTAPTDGVIRDVRVRPGQSVTSGQPLVTLSGPDSQLTLIVMLPGDFRPQLAIGQPGRFEVAGYTRLYQSVVLSGIADDLVGPTAAARYLGRDMANATTAGGPVVLAEASLDAESFTVDGQRYNFADGMQGQAQFRVRSIPIILNLVPGLRGFWEVGNRGVAE